MKIVDYKEYEADLNKFIQKHSKRAELHIWTSPFVQGEYHKDYLFEDGATFTELNKIDYVEEVEVEVFGVRTNVLVKLIKHEYWSTDDATSKFWFEKA